MNKNSLIVLGIAAVVIIGGGTSYAVVRANNNKEAAETAAMMKKDEATAMAKQEADASMKMEHEDDAMTKVIASDTTGDAMIKGSYTEYNQAKLANAEKGSVVLFFHAPWCPTCREADKNFSASSVPDGLTLLKTDYDSSNELKKQYGVTYQHTFVQVDKDGKLLKKWSASSTYDDVLKQII